MPVTKPEILKARAALKAQDPTLTPAQLTQGLRSLVFMKLREENPPPYQLPPPAPGKTPADFHDRLLKCTSEAEQKELHEESIMHRAERMAAMHAMVPPEVHVAFHRERPLGIQDAHHYAQMVHDRKLWKTVDEMVADAETPSGPPPPAGGFGTPPAAERKAS